MIIKQWVETSLTTITDDIRDLTLTKDQIISFQLTTAVVQNATGNCIPQHYAILIYND